MNYQQGASNQLVDSPTPAVSSIHSSFDNAIERMSLAVQQSSKIADRLSRIPNVAPTSGGKAASPEPTMTDKLEGLHTLIGMLESNLNFIGTNVG